MKMRIGGVGNYGLTQQLFHGHKMSGAGAGGTSFTLREMVKAKTVTLKHIY